MIVGEVKRKEAEVSTISKAAKLGIDLKKGGVYLKYYEKLFLFA